jgi:hypothetical protein
MLDFKWGWIVICIDLLVLGVVFFRLNKNKTSSEALRCGVALIVTGLVFSLLANFFRSSNWVVAEHLITYLSNFSLIIAGIGGNLIAASMLMVDGAAASQGFSGVVATPVLPIPQPNLTANQVHSPAVVLGTTPTPQAQTASQPPHQP